MEFTINTTAKCTRSSPQKTSKSNYIDRPQTQELETSMGHNLNQ